MACCVIKRRGKFIFWCWVSSRVLTQCGCGPHFRRFGGIRCLHYQDRNLLDCLSIGIHIQTHPLYALSPWTQTWHISPKRRKKTLPDPRCIKTLKHTGGSKITVISTFTFPFLILFIFFFLSPSLHFLLVISSFLSPSSWFLFFNVF
jgi:hypothetical protein